MDTAQSGCTFNDATGVLSMNYVVNFVTPVWKFTERDALANKEAGTIKFWGCSDSYDKRLEIDP